MLVSRDPFARAELHRVNDYSAQTCANCGGVRRTKTGKRYCYRYSTEFDSVSGRKSADAKAFCSISCRRAYGAAPEWR